MKSTRRKTAKAAKVLLAAMLAAGLLTAAAIASHAADPPPAEAAGAPNTGNPFENGDFRWDDNTQTYRVSGISIEVTSITKTGSSGYGGPFPSPQCLQRAWELSQQGLGGGHFPGWGAADFHYGSVVMTGNSRGIVFNDALPTSGHCAQRGNELTAWDAVRPARLILIEEKSYWEGGVYHACFAMLDNGHASGVWDQATMGDSYVWAEWTLTGNAEIVKQSASGDITDGNACYSLEGAVYGVYDNEACEGDPVTTLTTNADGWARAENIEAGSYWIKEIKPSPGYVLDPQVHPAQIEPGGTCTITSSEVPLSSTQGSAVTKSDNETGATSPQPSPSSHSPTTTACTTPSTKRTHPAIPPAPGCCAPTRRASQASGSPTQHSKAAGRAAPISSRETPCTATAPASRRSHSARSLSRRRRHRLDTCCRKSGHRSSATFSRDRTSRASARCKQSPMKSATDSLSDLKRKSSAAA